MATVVLDMRKAIGQRVSFLCDRGFQVVGRLTSLHPQPSPEQDLNGFAGSTTYDYDFAKMTDVQLLGAGGIVMGEHPEFTYPLRAVQSVVQLVEEAAPKAVEPLDAPLPLLYEVGREVPAVRAVAVYLEAEGAPLPDSGKKSPDKEWQGWDVGIAKLREQLEDKKHRDLRRWIALLPERKDLEKIVQCGAVPLLHGYQHLLESLMDSGPPSDIHTTLQRLYPLLTQWIATARHHSPF